jgi:hypothetical protein
MSDFTAAFLKSKGAPIEYQGRWLYLGYWFPVSVGDEIRVTFVKFAKQPVQGLRVGTRGKGCQLELAQQRGDDFVLWAETAPRLVKILVVEARSGAEVGLWNVWRDDKHGTMMYGVNNAAIDVNRQPDGRVLLMCSDGRGKPDFDDLVVEVEHIRKP